MSVRLKSQNIVIILIRFENNLVGGACKLSETSKFLAIYLTPKDHQHTVESYLCL